MATLVRTEDVLARFGGEEFTVLCRGTDLDGAKIVAERLRRAVEAHTFSFGGKDIPVTISLGIAAVPETAVSDHAAVPRGRRQGALRGEAHGPQPRLPPRLREDAQPETRKREQRADRRLSGYVTAPPRLSAGGGQCRNRKPRPGNRKHRAQNRKRRSNRRPPLTEPGGRRRTSSPRWPESRRPRHPAPARSVGRR